MFKRHTRYQLIMEIFSGLCLLGTMLYLALRWRFLPAQLPMHYNALGQIDRWGNRQELLLLPFLSLLLYAGLTWVFFKPQLANVPVTVTDDNRAAVYREVQNLLITLKLEVLLLFGYLTLHSVLATPLSVFLLPVTMIGILGTLVFFLMRFLALDGSSHS